MEDGIKTVNFAAAFTDGDSNGASPADAAYGEPEGDSRAEDPRADAPGADPHEGGDFADGPENGDLSGAEDLEGSGTPPEPEEADPALEAAMWKDKYLRSLADQENVRRRAEKQTEEIRKYGVERVLLEIIPVLDNLNLALSYINPEDAGAKNLALGVQMTVKDCLERLSPLGFKELSCQRGDPFDPNFHEALESQEDPELPDGTVKSVVKPGYSLHDRLLRPVMVRLVKNGG
ncbi:MAG: nucleotide exchange factor GrpE [Deltaproteobacteria bacterium]|jgi:molecular chaperone GrpE|nr:nucleotide exchange factor GrpE [Deltaproteobacteria bacterium]